MKKIILLFVLLGAGVFSESYCMSLSTTEEMDIGLSKFKLPIFAKYDLSDVYAGGLISVIDYKDTLYLDVGLMSNKNVQFLNVGISSNLPALCKIVGLNYRLPKPFVLGVSLGKPIDSNKCMFVYYLGLAGKFIE